LRAIRIIPPIAAICARKRRRSARPLSGPCYWARLPLDAGHAFALAGWEPLPRGRGAETWITALLDAPTAAELIVYADPQQGVFRYANLIDNRLDACLLLARSAHTLPSRDRLAQLLGT
jgi:assimilatory nitrate reductase catalytic subunit